MIRNILIFLSVLIVVFITDRVVEYYYDSAPIDKKMALYGDNVKILSKGITKPEKPLTIIPDFIVHKLDGETHRLSDFQGKIVLINFWATWCAPCVVEFPKLLKLADSHPDVIVIFLSSDVSRKNIEDFVRRQPAEFQAIVKRQNIVMAKDQRSSITGGIFQTYKLPETVILDKNGQLVRKIVGDIDWQSAEINEYFHDLQKRGE